MKVDLIRGSDDIEYTTSEDMQKIMTSTAIEKVIKSFIYKNSVDKNLLNSLKIQKNNVELNLKNIKEMYNKLKTKKEKLNKEILELSSDTKERIEFIKSKLFG